jgi:hypothetical protein
VFRRIAALDGSIALGLLCCCSSPTPVVEAPAPGVEPERAGMASTGDGATAAEAHEVVLRSLASSDSVLPPAPPVHPFRAVFNAEAIIPPMCYTRTEGRHNPCYVCHQDQLPGRPNRMNDADLQQAYSFSELGTQNHWRNLFEDRSARVAAISDAEIVAWVSQDNYSELAPRLRAEGFAGFVPDLTNLALAAGAFDAEGFARDGSHWVAFNYKPLPSTFWPTNGATDDVMIRLPAPYRETAEGVYARDVYEANLAILEARIKGLSRVSVHSVDEKAVGTDLDGDGELGVIAEISRVSSFVGAASKHFTLPHLYPLDTEFLHSVRYVGVDEAGNIHVPPRMKELRYMRKRFMLTSHQLIEAYRQEGYDKELGRLPGYVDREQYGLDNEMGWLVSGFIEDRHGRLRFNTYEENLFCMGCHTSIGSTIDNTFSFARKVDGAEGWGYIELRGMPDAPNQGETRGEIATYLERAGGGGEFRSNPEMEARWFSAGAADAEKLAKARDVYDLITPSRERALELNKAYRVIVSDQDFIYGRDATVAPPPNVYEAVDNAKSPTLPRQFIYAWDIRLDWANNVRRGD